MTNIFFNFPSAWQINFGKHVGNFVRWLVQNYSFIGILWFLLQTRGLFLWIPWPVFIVIVFILGWKIKNWKSGVTFAGLIFLIGVMGLWEEMMLTLSVVLVAVVIAGLIGVAYNERLETIVKPVLDAMQTMPSFVYLIPAIMLFGLGTVPAVFATVVYATPPAIRLTDLATGRW